jgi:hypothetical protein
MTLEEMNIPASIKKEAADLISRIELADGLLDLSTAGGEAGLFMCGQGLFWAVTLAVLGGAWGARLADEFHSTRCKFVSQSRYRRL